MLKTVEAMSRTSAGNTWVNASSSTTLSFFQMTGAASQLRALASKNSDPNSCILSRGFFRLLSSHGARVIPVVGSEKQRRFMFSASGCCCSQTNGHVRAWVVYKEGRMASTSAWFHAGRSAGDFTAESLTGRCGSENGGSDHFSGDEEQGSKPEKQDGEEGKTNSVVPSIIERQRLTRERRQIEVGLGTASSVSAASLPGNPDLLMIPGVGPRNLRKLVDKGIGGVTELKQLYRDKFYGESSKKMVNFLQTSVGIIHRHHAESITSFIKHSVDEEMKEDIPHSDEKRSHRKKLTFCVEGNISVGKTTFLHRIANDTIELRDLVEVVPEPISKWQDVGPDHFNVLDAFYAEPHRYAYTFQNYVFVTRVMQERESAGGIKPLRLMERSIFSDRMVFVRAVHEANWMNEMEINIYDSWFDPVVSCLPGLIPDGFIYLRASPDTCHKRLKIRNRAEEGGVTLDYLRELHEKHESWLFPFQSGNHGILSVSQLTPHTNNSLHPDIRDRVFYLEGEHMHSSIQKVPALVLDCEPDIDFSKDFEAKQVYARQVAQFFEYVKKKKEVSSEEASDGRKSMNPHILLPREGGFLVPEGNHLPQSLDLRRTMSFMST